MSRSNSVGLEDAVYSDGSSNGYGTLDSFDSDFESDDLGETVDPSLGEDVRVNASGGGSVLSRLVSLSRRERASQFIEDYFFLENIDISACASLEEVIHLISEHEGLVDYIERQIDDDSEPLILFLRRVGIEIGSDELLEAIQAHRGESVELPCFMSEPPQEMGVNDPIGPFSTIGRLIDGPGLFESQESTYAEDAAADRVQSHTLLTLASRLFYGEDSGAAVSGGDDDDAPDPFS